MGNSVLGCSSHTYRGASARACMQAEASDVTEGLIRRLGVSSPCSVSTHAGVGEACCNMSSVHWRMFPSWVHKAAEESCSDILASADNGVRDTCTPQARRNQPERGRDKCR